MSADEMKNVIRRHLEEMWHEGKLEIAEEICAENLTYHDPASSAAISLASYKEYITAVRTAFPDLRYVVYDMISEGDKVMVRWCFEGTQKGAIRGIRPTDRHVSFTGMSLYTIENGKITEAWTNWDTYGYLQQLDALPVQRRMNGGKVLRAEG